MATVRLARKPIPFPSALSVEMVNNSLRVKNNSQERFLPVNKDVKVDISVDNCFFSAASKNSDMSILGTTVSLFKNIIADMQKNTVVNILLAGIGFKAFMVNENDENYLVMNIGFSHLVAIQVPNEIKLVIKEASKLELSGFLEDVMLFSNDIISLRPWDACRRKGIVFAEDFPTLPKKVKK